MFVFTGCEPQPVTGGTAGKLLAGQVPLSDIQITIHQFDSGMTRPIGFGVTVSDGTFALFTSGAKGSLHLVPGDYVCTLESVGAPVQIPIEFTRPETSPLKVHWDEGEESLQLSAPSFPAIR